LGQKEYLGIRDEQADSASGFKSINLRETDVQQDQVWSQFFGFLNGFQAI
jgi:hypothetical protein